jgi:hypothetical protein
MKKAITAFAAMFSLMMLIAPVGAHADAINFPVAVQQAGYVQPVGYYRPWACSNHYFRRHHWWMCR